MGRRYTFCLVSLALSLSLSPLGIEPMRWMMIAGTRSFDVRMGIHQNYSRGKNFPFCGKQEEGRIVVARD